MPDFMPGEKPRAFVRWDANDYTGLFCLARERGRPGTDTFLTACMEVMEKLPESDQITLADLTKRLRDKTAQRVIGEVERLNKAERKRFGATWLAFKEPVPASDHWILWTRFERLLLARRISYMRRDLGDPRALSRLLMVAQRYELQPDRWRNDNSLQANTSAKGNEHKVWEELIRESLTAPEIAHIPFDPNAPVRTLTNPGLAPLEALPQAPAPVAPPPPPPPEPVAERTPGDIDIEVILPEPPAVSLAELAARGAEALKTSQEPLEALLATPASPEREKPLLGGSSDYRGHLLLGLEGMVDNFIDRALARLKTDLRRTQEQLMAKGIEILDERMEVRIKRMAESLLGDLRVPDTTLAPVPEMTGEGLEHAIKIDVLGLHGQQIVEVKKALNGHADSVRFVDAAKLDAWTPRDYVLINARMGLGLAERKCQKAKAHIHRYWGTASSAVQTITEIYTQQGIPLGGSH